MNVWIVILIVLLGLVLLAGGVIALVVWLTRPVSKATPAHLCPGCGQAIPPEVTTCPKCTCRLLGPQMSGRGVTLLSGPLSGQSFALRPPPRGLLIGREADNDIVLDTAMVSRHHAQIMLEGDQVVLYDRDSTNGTWLADGRRVARHVLSVGDRFQIGDTVFVYGPLNQPIPSPTPGAETQPTTPLQPQTYFEGYWLLNVLGHGGMSVVYRAQKPDGTEVALKILDATDEWIARKFLQEGNIGAALRGHPNIRIVYDLCYSQDRRPYLVMEYVEGTSLRRMMGTRLPLPQIIALIGQTCEALEFAHQHRIVHRDIKPENILVTHEGMVKVTDFGIAKLTSAVTVTSDRIVGTPEYISPEQAKGEEVGPTSDIYSLGVVLYELLTGQVPFPLPQVSETQDQRGAAYTVIRQHISVNPTPPGRLNPSLSASPLEKVTLKALEKDPARRYQSAMELAHALGYRPGAPSPGPAPTTTGARLVVLEGSNPGRVIPVQEKLVLGRAMLDPENVHISRQHAILMQRGQEWWIQDTSVNGTWVNGQRIYGQAPLTGDRIIVIGECKLQLQI